LQPSPTAGYYKRYLSAILCIVGGYFALYLMDQSLDSGRPTVCLFKLATGLPCPGCGMGRATIALFHGHFVDSLYYNVLCIPFTLAVWTLLLWMGLDLLRHRETAYPFLMRRASLPLSLLLVALIAANWALNIFHGI
jgi:Protein of unknown function (DUF2752)